MTANRTTAANLIVEQYRRFLLGTNQLFVFRSCDSFSSLTSSDSQHRASSGRESRARSFASGMPTSCPADPHQRRLLSAGIYWECRRRSDRCALPENNENYSAAFVQAKV
jgi:hypothetical protein